jgi:hypothetical protein
VDGQIPAPFVTTDAMIGLKNNKKTKVVEAGKETSLD